MLLKPTMDTIICPHCKKQVELSEAIIHEFQEKIREEEKKLARAAFEKEKAEEKVEHEKKLRIEFELKNKEQLRELAQIRIKEEEAKKREKQLQEKLAKEKEERVKEEEKIKELARKKAEEDVQLKLKQKDIQLEQARKANQELNRKLEQSSSQQLQGEALELHLEEKLRAAFPNDEFLPVPKGVEGGDIWQKIMFKNNIVGSILWETKQTKAWSKSWLLKLKDDIGKIDATEAILVSHILPSDASQFDRKEGIWITTYEHAITVCRFVRFLVTSMAIVKSSTNHTEEEWGQIRNYMMSDAFKNRMQSHFDGIKQLRVVLDAEKRATMLRWKKQEGVIDKLDRNTINFYGELKTIVSGLPELNGVDTILTIDESTDSNETNF